MYRPSPLRLPLRPLFWAQALTAITSGTLHPLPEVQASLPILGTSDNSTPSSLPKHLLPLFQAFPQYLLSARSMISWVYHRSGIFMGHSTHLLPSPEILNALKDLTPPATLTATYKTLPLLILGKTSVSLRFIFSAQENLLQFSVSYQHPWTVQYSLKNLCYPTHDLPSAPNSYHPCGWATQHYLGSVLRISCQIICSSTLATWSHNHTLKSPNVQ